MCGIGGLTTGYAEWASETVESLACRSGPGPPGSQGGQRGEDIAPSMCGIEGSTACNCRVSQQRLAVTMLATPVLCRLGARGSLGERTVPP